jgi:hypothetical protein
MPVSRKRKRRTPPQKRQSPQNKILPALPSAPQIAVRRSLWVRFRDHPIWWTAGALAALLTIGAAVWQALSGPQLSLAANDVTLPFAVPIVATNNSWPFYMTDIEVDCGVQDISWSGGGGIKGITFAFPQTTRVLAPGKPEVFQCNITNVPRYDLIKADVFVSVSYKMLWVWRRKSDEMEITWFTGTSRPRWVVGNFPTPHMQ